MIGIIVIGFIILILITDLILFLKGGFPNTISYWIWQNSLKYPIIPFLAGLLMGHFFWDQCL